MYNEPPDKPSPKQSIVAPLISTLGFLFLLGLAADAIQVLTFDKYGPYIFVTILAISLVISGARLYLQVNRRLEYLETENTRLRYGLRRLQMELSTRSKLNSDPATVIAWAYTSQFEKADERATITKITKDNLVVDVGGTHNLVQGMIFEIFSHDNPDTPIEQCHIEAVLERRAFLLHSGQNLKGDEDIMQYFLRPTYPPITPEGKLLAKLILMTIDLEAIS